MASRGVHHSSVAQDLEDIEKNCREDAMILGHRPSHRHKKENMSHHTTSSAATQVQEESSMSLRRHGSPTHQHTTSAESANKTLHTLDDAGPDSIMVDKGDGMSYMLQGTRPTHPVPDEARPRRPPLHLPMPEFDEAHPEDLKNRKSTEKDKQVIDDFESDLRSLSSDEDDSGHGRRHLRRVNCWHKLSPFMRSLIMAILGFVLFIVPCVLINAFVRISSGEESRSEYSVFQKYTAIDWLSWLGFMWVIAVITHFCIDRVPRLVIQFNHLIWGVCTEKTKGRIEYFVAIKFYIKILIFFSWAWGSYVIVMKVFPSSPYLTEDDIAQGLTWHEPFYYRTIYRIFSALFYGSLLLLVEKMILQIIAIRFHRTAYRDRIRTNKREIKMLDRLCEGARHIRRLSQSPAQMTGTQNSGASTPAWFGHSTKASESWHPQRETPGSSSKEHANGSYFPAHKRQPSQQHLISALNRKLQYIAMADQPEMQTKRMDYNSNYNARKLARWLYETLTQGNSRELVVEDFLLCFDTEEEAKEAFALFDRDNNGDISRRELRDVVVRIYKERKDLAAALRDLSQCVGKLDNILMSIAVIIYIFMVLNIVAEETISSVVVPFGSLLVTLSFIFGQSAKNTFDSIIYVFVTHPYDTGDVVYIDEDQLVVENVGLLTTTFRRSDGQVIYAPNIILATKFIHNIRRSQNMSETIKIQVDFYTPPEKIKLLGRRLEEYIEQHMFREFVPKLNINIESIDNTNRLVLTMFIEHKSNWQDGGRRWARRTQFMMALKDIVTELDMRYYLPPQRVEFTPSTRGSGQPPDVAPWAPYPNTNVDAEASNTGNRTVSNNDTARNQNEMSRQIYAMETIL